MQLLDSACPKSSKNGDWYTFSSCRLTNPLQRIIVQEASFHFAKMAKGSIFHASREQRH